MDWQLLQDLSDGERRQALAGTRRRTFARGEVLFHEGDPADTVHFVAEGRVVARRVNELGDSVAFRVIGAGRVIGDVAVSSTAQRRSSTIVALEPVVTFTMTFEQFQRLCIRHPEVERRLAALLAARVRRLSDRLLESFFVPIDRRVARRLAELCEEYAGGPGDVVVPLTQTDLAELSGTTRPTTNRILRALAADGVVSLARQRIVVHDVERLRRR